MTEGWQHKNMYGLHKLPVFLAHIIELTSDPAFANLFRQASVKVCFIQPKSTITQITITVICKCWWILPSFPVSNQQNMFQHNNGVIYICTVFLKIYSNMFIFGMFNWYFLCFTPAFLFIKFLQLLRVQ